jgi:hypothetical protein
VGHHPDIPCADPGPVFAWGHPALANWLGESMQHIPDPVIRAGRTFVQSFIGIFLALVVSGSASNAVPDYSILKTAALAAAWGAFIGLLSFIQNQLEQSTGQKILPK